MCKVIQFRDRLEKWRESYISPDGKVRIKTSNQGRLFIQMNDEITRLDFMDTVDFLTSVSEQIHKNMFDSE